MARSPPFQDILQQQGCPWNMATSHKHGHGRWDSETDGAVATQRKWKAKRLLCPPLWEMITVVCPGIFVKVQWWQQPVPRIHRLIAHWRYDINDNGSCFSGSKSSLDLLIYGTSAIMKGLRVVNTAADTGNDNGSAPRNAKRHVGCWTVN